MKELSKGIKATSTSVPNTTHGPLPGKSPLRTSPAPRSPAPASRIPPGATQRPRSSSKPREESFSRLSGQAPGPEIATHSGSLGSSQRTASPRPQSPSTRHPAPTKRPTDIATQRRNSASFRSGSSSPRPPQVLPPVSSHSIALRPTPMPAQSRSRSLSPARRT